MPAKPIRQSPVKKKARDEDDIIAQIQDVSEFDSDEGTSLLVYGKSGSGKTRLMATFPKPILLIGSEKGTKSIKNVTGVKFVRLRKSEQMGTLVEHAKTTKKYKTVALDTATMFQELVLQEILDLEEIPVQKSWGMATREDYGQCALQVKQYLRRMLDLTDHGINVVIVAQEKELSDEDGDETSDLEIKPGVMAALQKSIVGWLNPACDNVVETFIRRQVLLKPMTVKGSKKPVMKKIETGKKEFCLRITPHERYMIKIRNTPDMDDKKPEALVNPTYERLKPFI